VKSRLGTRNLLNFYSSVAPQDYGGRGWSLSILTEPKYLPDGQSVHVEEPVQVPDLQLTSSRREAAAVPDQGEAGSLPIPSSTSQPVAAGQTPLFKKGQCHEIKLPVFPSPISFYSLDPFLEICYIRFLVTEESVNNKKSQLISP
jgi:hypothetical protein